MENETRNKPEWFDVGPVMKKEVGNLSFEVWANKIQHRCAQWRLVQIRHFKCRKLAR